MFSWYNRLQCLRRDCQNRENFRNFLFDNLDPGKDLMQNNRENMMHIFSVDGANMAFKGTTAPVDIHIIETLCVI